MNEQAETPEESEGMGLGDIISALMGEANPREQDVKAATQALCEVMKENSEFMDDITALTDQVSKLLGGHNSAIIVGVLVNVAATLAGDMYKHQSANGDEPFDAEDAHVLVEAAARLMHMATDEVIRQVDAGRHDD